MKAQTSFRACLALVAGGALVASVMAGPGPQYWNKSAPKPAAKPALVKMDEHPTGKCDGCKTTPIWVISDRGPSGKGVPGAHVTGYSHSCTGCLGHLTTETGKSKADMQHSAGCARLACCQIRSTAPASGK